MLEMKLVFNPDFPGNFVDSLLPMEHNLGLSYSRQMLIGHVLL